MATRAVFRKTIIQQIPTVSWGTPECIPTIRRAVAASEFLVVQNVLNSAQCQAIADRTRHYGGAQMLVPFEGENIVSFARNEWTEEEKPVLHLLLEEEDSSSIRFQTRLALNRIFDHRQDLPKNSIQQLLGGFDINEEASMVFVTARQLRTPLHSDERHGMLLHIDGIKNYVCIPAASSDANHKVLRDLLKLRDSCGMHDDLYQEDRPAVPALSKIAGYYRGPLPPGSALFLPQRNLHDLESVTPTISISLRFGAWDVPNNKNE